MNTILLYRKTYKCNTNNMSDKSVIMGQSLMIVQERAQSF